MKKATILTLVSVLIFTLTAFTTSEKLTSNKIHVQFFSSTPAEDIVSNNYKATSSLDKTTGEIIFSVPMQSFEFEKSLMQKHYNSDKFLDTKAHPRARLVAKINNLGSVNFNKDGNYSTEVSGEMTIKGVTKPFKEKINISVEGKTVKIQSEFDITLADYGVAFSKGKPSTNIAKTVAVTVNAEYQPE